jgi:di/tricarboxylate transporter
VLAILRGEERIAAGVSGVPLREDDVLIAQGSLESIVRLRNEQGVALLPDIKLRVAELSSNESVVMEGLIPLGSALVGRTLRSLDFRRGYGAFVLAIRRLGTTIREKIAHVALHPADTLLMLVPTDGLTALHESRDLILLSEHELELRRGRFWWLILVLLPAAVLLAALGVMDIAVGAMLATVLLLLARSITPQEAYRSIEWPVLFLIAAFIPVGRAIVDTGTAGFLASGLVAAANLLRPELAPYLALSLTYLATSLLTQMISNNAAAIIVAPLAFTLASDLGVDARPFLVAVAFAASAEFMTPMGYQTNMMVYGPGGYRFLDYTRFGAPLNLSFWLLSTLLIPLLWPF